MDNNKANVTEKRKGAGRPKIIVDEEILKNQLIELEQLDFNLDVLGWDVLPSFADDIDYSILDDDKYDSEINEYANEVKKAIQIEFESSDYEEAKQLVASLRSDGAYIGGILLNYLRKEVG